MILVKEPLFKNIQIESSRVNIWSKNKLAIYYDAI